MLAIRNFEYRSHRALLERFCDLARTGRILPGDPPGHADGWGIGYYRDGIAAVCKSGGSLLDEQDTYFERLAAIGRSPVLIAHLRKSAWPATTTAANAHPFACGNAIFAHNGTVRDYKTLLPAITVPSPEPLDTALDTYVFFLHILSGAAGGDLAAGFRASVGHIRQHNTYSSLTCVLADAGHLYGYRDFAAHEDYYTLYHAAQENSAVLSSEPLDPALRWRLLERGEMITL
jgi:glutamine amidotransferase